MLHQAQLWGPCSASGPDPSQSCLRFQFDPAIDLNQRLGSDRSDQAVQLVIEFFLVKIYSVFLRANTTEQERKECTVMLPSLFPLNSGRRNRYLPLQAI